MKSVIKSATAIAGVLCVGMLAAGPALAADNGLAARLFANMLFQTGDANGDGRLDADEIAALRLLAFQRADANGDGTVSQTELQKAAEKRQRRADMARLIGEERIDQFDLDGDGQISLAEFQSAPRPGMALVDINSDGVIDRAELDRITAIIAAAR